MSLWNSAGIPCPPDLSCDLNVFDNGGADFLLPLIGWTQTNATTFVAEGIVAEAGPLPGEHHTGSLEGARFFADHTQVGFFFSVLDANPNPGFGHWLVAVPEPTAGLLVALVILSVALLKAGTAWSTS